MKLYEISNEIELLMEAAVDPETGEIDEDAYLRLQDLQGEMRDKLEGVALGYKNAKADIEAYKAEKQSFADKQKAAEKKAEAYQQCLIYFLKGEKLKTDRVTVSYRKSDELIIDEGAVIPEEFLRYKEPEVNKAELKKALKEGLELPGAYIAEKSNIQIK